MRNPALPGAQGEVGVVVEDEERRGRAARRRRRPGGAPRSPRRPPPRSPPAAASRRGSRTSSRRWPSWAGSPSGLRRSKVVADFSTSRPVEVLAHAHQAVGCSGRRPSARPGSRARAPRRRPSARCGPSRRRTPSPCRSGSHPRPRRSRRCGSRAAAGRRGPSTCCVWSPLALSTTITASGCQVCATSPSSIRAEQVGPVVGDDDDRDVATRSSARYAHRGSPPDRWPVKSPRRPAYMARALISQAGRARAG